MNNKGQMSVEYLFLAGVLILIVMISAVFIVGEQELDIAMMAARNGVVEATSSSVAIYPSDTYKDYSNSKESLIYPYSVDIINISYSELGMDNNYEKKKIQFKVYATTSGDFTKSELDSIGTRINFNLRKSIALSFNSTSYVNKLYNPVFSPHYVFTTANVVWI